MLKTSPSVIFQTTSTSIQLPSKIGYKLEKSYLCTQNILLREEIKAYMSIMSLIRTLTAASIDGFPLLLSFDDTVMMLGFVEEDISEQTAEITSHTSFGFKRRGCCSLTHRNIVSEREREREDGKGDQ